MRRLRVNRSYMLLAGAIVTAALAALGVYGLLCAVNRWRSCQPDPMLRERLAEQFNRRHNVADPGNGALIYSRAFQKMPSDRMPRSMSRQGTKTVWRTEDHADWAAWLGKWQESFEIALKARQAERTCFPLTPADQTLSPPGQVPPSDAGKLSDALICEALGLAGDGHVDRAATHLGSAFHLGTAWARGTIGKFVVARSIRRRAVDAAVAILAAGPNAGREEAIPRLLDEWRQEPFVTDEHWREYGTVYAAVEAQNRIGDWRTYTLQSRIDLFRLGGSGFYVRTLTQYWDRVRAWRSLPWSECRPRLAAVHEELFGDRGLMRSTPRLRALQPTHDQVAAEMTAERIDGVYLVLAGTCAAVAQFAQAKGSFPASLEELTPEFLDETPKDPFTGGPLAYRRRKAGFIVYSFGPNVKDDRGGRIRDLPLGTGDVAIVFQPRTTDKTRK